MAACWRYRSSRRLARGLGFLVLGGAVACGSGGSSHQGSVARLITEDPQVVLEHTDWMKAETVEEWRFATRADAQGWTDIGRDKPLKLASGQLWVSAADRPERLVRAVSLDAGSVDAFELTLTGLKRGAARLFWAGPGEDFTAERSVEVRAEQGVSRSEEATYIFPVGSHPLWRGPIERIRLDPTHVPSEVVQVRRLRAVAYSLPADRLAQELQRPWKVVIASEARNAVLAAPGVARELKVTPPRGAVLRFGYALEPGVGQPVVFSVVARHGNAEATKLWQAELDPGAPGEAGWHDAVVDLGPVVGREVTLALETSSSTPLNLTRGFPVWADPEVVGQVPGRAPVNVVLISVDTLRADRLSLYGHDRQTSPELSAWAARRAVVFRHAVAATPWTLPSHISMLTGLHAFHHGVNHEGPAPPSLDMLAEILRRQGYATAATTGGLYLSPQEGFTQGFDSFFFWTQRDRDSELESGVDRAVSWMSGHRAEPFFLFLHTYEVHSPYHARQPFMDRFAAGRFKAPYRNLTTRPVPRVAEDGYKLRKRFVKEGTGGDAVDPAEIELAGTLYDASVAFTDQQIGRLLDSLETLGVADRTLVIFTSDHGEALGERGLAAHAYLYDFNLMIPMVVAFPQRRGAGETVDAQVATVDIVPTVLDVLGLPMPTDLDGSSMVPLVAGSGPNGAREAWSYAASSDFGVSLRVSDRVKYVFDNTAWSQVNGHEELFRLREDPGEEHDLAASDPDTPGLRARMADELATMSGLRLRFTAPAGSPLQGTLSASRIDPSWIKQNQPSGDKVSWERPGTVRFAVPAGGQLELMVETLDGRTFDLEVRPGTGGRRLELTVDPTELTDPLIRVLGPEGWAAAGAPPEGAAAVEVFWHGEVRPQAGDRERATTGADPEFQAQLKALGYVND